MSGFGGWGAGLPLEIGGGDTLTEGIVEALFSVVGVGHAADADGIEWRWRESRAIGLAALAALAERAASQYYPRSSPDLAPFRDHFYDTISEVEERERENLHARYVDDSIGVIPEIVAMLQSFDERFSFYEKDRDHASVTWPARPFEPLDGSAPFNVSGGERETKFPNVSSTFELIFLYDLGPRVPSSDLEIEAERRARAYLDDALPAWCDYRIVTSIGFVAGVSPVGYTLL